MKKLFIVILLSFSVFGGTTYYLLPLQDHSPYIRIQDDKPEITVAIIGDFGTGNFRQRRVAAILEQACRTYDLDFVQTVGDNFYPSGVNTPHDSKWSTHFENKYNTPCLKEVRFFAALGNHDHELSAKAQIDYTDMGSKRWFLPNHYYAHEHKVNSGSEEILLKAVVVDTNLWGNEQANFIRNELQNTNSIWKIVVGHANIRTFGEKYNKDDRFQKSLLPILKANMTDFYVSGHTHSLQLIKVDNEPLYLISGGGGKTPRALIKEPDNSLVMGQESLGVILVTFRKTEAIIRFISTSGQFFSIYETSISAFRLDHTCWKQSVIASCLRPIKE
tara:strand:+ start:434 stop:1429 length:996 start_codon:yes stop_codon:yes gene_type:complete